MMSGVSRWAVFSPNVTRMLFERPFPARHLRPGDWPKTRDLVYRLLIAWHDTDDSRFDTLGPDLHLRGRG